MEPPVGKKHNIVTKAFSEKPAGAACESCPRRDEPCIFPEVPDGKIRLTVVADEPTFGDAKANSFMHAGSASGRLLDQALRRFVGVKREEAALTHAVLCPGTKKTLAAARKCCAKRFQEEVRAYEADTHIALGGVALQSLMGVSKLPNILRYRGFVISDKDPLKTTKSVPGNIIATLPPWNVVRSEQWKNIFGADMARAGRVLENGFVPPEEKDGEIHVVDSLPRLRELLPKLANEIVADIETVEIDGTNDSGKGPDIHTNRMTCFVIADEHLSLVLPWSKTVAGTGRFWNGHQDEVVKLVNDAMASRTVITHNGPAYDHIGLGRRGFELRKWDDSMLGYHVITSHFPKRLDHVVSCYLDAPPWKQWDHFGELEKLWHYCGQDGLYTARVKRAIWEEMDEDDKRVYESDKSSALICREMSTTGFMFDKAKASEISKSLQAHEAVLLERCRELAGMPDLNVKSPKQLQRALFQSLKAPVYFRTATGDPATSKEALRAYAASANQRLADFALAIIEYRSAAKCRSTYVDAIKIHADGRVRPTWMSTGTVSGRWSCKGPNLANLYKPQRDPSKELGGIRSLYTASPGNLLVSFDVSQAEFRVAAYLSGDPNMIAATKGDIHWNNAKLIFGLPDDLKYDKNNPAMKDMRDLAKNAGFAVCYLAEAGTVHQRTVADGGKASMQQVEDMCDALHTNFSTYFDFQSEQLNLTIRRGYVETPILKRKRWLGHNPEPPATANFQIQGGAADAMNLKLEKIYKLRDERGLRAKGVAMVYDASYWDTHEDDVEKMESLIREVWEEPTAINGREMILPIDMHSAFRWSEL